MWMLLLFLLLLTLRLFIIRYLNIIFRVQYGTAINQNRLCRVFFSFYILFDIYWLHGYERWAHSKKQRAFQLHNAQQ